MLARNLLARLYSTRPPLIKLTSNAVGKLKTLNESDKMILKIGVKSKGCSGLAYHLERVERKLPTDEEINQDGVQVLIDGKALFSLIGATMDHREDDLSSQFTFENPNVKESCGCGKSFLVD